MSEAKKIKKHFKPNARHKARYLALQALYQWQMTNVSPRSIESQFEEQLTKKVDAPYFKCLLNGVIDNKNDLDQQAQQFIDRPLKQLDPVELSLIRVGLYELIHCQDVPYRVVINEAVELAKQFGATDGHKYINGILDRAASLLRSNASGNRT